jgi:hypothetical protein
MTYFFCEGRLCQSLAMETEERGHNIRGSCKRRQGTGKRSRSCIRGRLLLLSASASEYPAITPPSRNRRLSPGPGSQDRKVTENIKDQLTHCEWVERLDMDR